MDKWDERICFGVTVEVKRELELIAKDNDMRLDDFMRCLVDDFILNTPD